MEVINPTPIPNWHARILRGQECIELQRVLPPPGYTAFGLVLERDDALLVDRRPVRSDSLLVLAAGRSYDFQAVNDASLLGMTLERAMFAGAGPGGIYMIDNALTQTVVPLQASAQRLLRHFWLMLSPKRHTAVITPPSLLAETALSNILLALALSGVAGPDCEKWISAPGDGA